MRTSASLLLTAITSAALSGAACMEPLQNGGVLIIGDPSERLGTMCRFRHGDAASDSFCPSDAPGAVAARVRRIVGTNDGLAGPYASGRSGDYVLENDEIAIVIDQLGGGQGLAEGGGNIVDAADVKLRVDALGQMFTTLGMSMKQPLYESIRTGSDGDGSAWVEVAGREIHDERLRVRTRYTLAAGTRALAVDTELENTGTVDIPDLDLGDTVLWGGAAHGAPGQNAGFQGDASAPYLFGVGEGVAYAIATDGRPFLSKSGASSSTTALLRGATIAAGATLSYQRLFVVAPRGDTAAVATELFFLGGGAPGGLAVEIAWDGPRIVRANENHISLRRLPLGASGAAADDASTTVAPPAVGTAEAASVDTAASAATFPDPPSLWLALPAGGPITAELAPGRYAAKLEGAAGTSTEGIADVVPGKTTKLTLRATPRR